ncbi:MAG: hypothetical protein NC122_05555 [Faecalibacterium sp.]|nr:hypothetical protein [Ruminococcus sp.]MCM1391219.1 hypothetical protein [Ruminococcus sp.]MCM1485653.1 hypothetical protein [Faecalibacterium sp.]
MEKFHSHAQRLLMVAKASKIDSLNRLISLFLKYDTLRKLLCMLKLDDKLLGCKQELNSLMFNYMAKYADFNVPLFSILPTEFESVI